MKFVRTVAALVLTISASHATAQSMIQAAEAIYPSCALLCLAEYVPLSGCSETDTSCLCTNVQLQTNITECVLSTCTTLYEELMTKNATETLCGGEVRDESLTPLLAGMIGGGVALLVFIMRMCSTLPRGGRMAGWDDYTMIVTVALATPPTVFSVLLSQNGLGKDIWTLPLHNIENVLFYYYLGEIFYFSALSMNKISLLLFMLRVFPDRTFRKIVYIVIGLCIAYGVSFILATAFQCSPINYSWLQIDSTVRGSCNNINLQGWLSAIFNITIDLIIIVLPLKSLYGLQINWKKKFMIMLMFSVGIFVTLVSVIRLRSLILFADSENITWDYSPAAWWSTIELHVGIICACLPALRSLFVSLGVKVLGSTKGRSRGDTYHSSGSVTLGRGVMGSTNSEKSTPSFLKRGGESDFIPLVDMPDSKMQKKPNTLSTVNEGYDGEFDRREFHDRAPAYSR
ncbi:CFEM domain-containing protein [Xylariales sp. PMI_506]|nr:CFEM domain-containing protein [Xylariales sp. PMI_506]